MHVPHMSSCGIGPIGDGILMEILVCAQRWCRQSCVALVAVTLDHEIEWVIQNWIQQDPGSYRFIAIGENIINARYLFGRNPAEASAAFSSGTKYIANSVVWYISRNHS